MNFLTGLVSPAPTLKLSPAQLECLCQPHVRVPGSNASVDAGPCTPSLLQLCDRYGRKATESPKSLVQSSTVRPAPVCPSSVPMTYSCTLVVTPKDVRHSSIDLEKRIDQRSPASLLRSSRDIFLRSGGTLWEPWGNLKT